MKKLFVFISALFALVACNKEIDLANNEINKKLDEQSQEIKVNLSINRTDAYTDTKATVKTGWVNGDVVFVFFKGIAAPKYLEMRYDGTEWIATSMNSLTAGDLSGAADKKMTAIYLPYGSTATVASDEGNFVFGDLTYSGYFLQAELANYTYDTELRGNLNMTAPAPATDGDKHIHFDITGFTSSHSYYLSQDYVKPITFSRVSSEGIVSHTEGSMGDFMTGYYDSNNSIISFSGILDASAIGVSLDYQFSIDDETSSVLYTRDAGTKKLSEAKYIGIGDITDTSNWRATEYIDFGLSVKFAKCNLGASSPEEVGNFYAWGELLPKSNYDMSTYVWSDGNYGFTKYNATDGLTTLEPCDDAAHVTLGGRWKIPTQSEFSELMNCGLSSGYFSKYNGVDGRLFSRIGKELFFPETGYMEGTTWYNKDRAEGEYWTSTLYDQNHPFFWKFFHSEYAYFYRDQPRTYRGHVIRPVFKGR